jgi:RNA polymerase sigma-70 factor (ECF subfamily)
MSEEKERIDDDDFFTRISEQKHRLFYIAYSYLKNEADALEAVQEATCRAYLKRKSLKDPERFAPWIIRILIHFCADEQKRKRKTLPLLHVPEKSDGQSGDISGKLDLEMALEKLKPVYRHIVILKYMQDMTIAEIAAVMDRPESTIKTWLYKGLKQLRKLLGEDGRMGHA